MKLARTSYQRGSLRKVERAKGFVWEFRYRTTINGKRNMKQKTLNGSEFPSEAAARRKLDTLLLDINETEPTSEYQDVQLATLIDAYKQTEMPERPKSRINYLLLLERHIRPKWQNTYLSQVKPHAVQVWLAALQYAPETKRHIRNMLFRLIEFAMRKGIIPVGRNPIELVRVKGSTRFREKVVLTPQQFGQITSRLANPHRLMVQLSAFLGLRICEVLGLQWGDVDYQRLTLHIRRSAVDGNVGDTKTAASQDSLPLTQEMLILLEDWKIKAPQTLEGWLFPSPVTGRPQHAGSLLRRQIKPIARALDLPSLGWHSFRTRTALGLTR